MLRPLLRWTALAVSTALAACGAEWLWRGLVRGQYRAACAAFAEPMLALCEGPSLYRMRANLAFEHRIAAPDGGPPTVVTYHTDAQGHRSRGPLPPPLSGAAPVWFVGDSYTFGIGVADGEAFPFVAEDLLRATNTPIAATDAGVPGHDAVQVLATLEAMLAAAATPPKLVVYGFVQNDAEPPTYVPIPLDARYGAAPSWLAEDGKGLANLLGAMFVDDRPLCEPHQPTYDFDYRRSWAPGAAKGRAALVAITAMHDRCRAVGVRFLAVVLPDFTRTFDATYPFGAIHAQMQMLGAARGFPTLDLLVALHDADAATLRVPGDGHPNAAGQRRIAECMAPGLQELLRE